MASSPITARILRVVFGAGLAIVAVVSCASRGEENARAQSSEATRSLAPSPDAPRPSRARVAYHGDVRDRGGVGASLEGLDHWDQIDVYPLTSTPIDRTRDTTYDFTRGEGVDRFTVRTERGTDDGETRVYMNARQPLEVTFRAFRAWSRSGVVRAESDGTVVMIATAEATSLCVHGEERSVEAYEGGSRTSVEAPLRCYAWPDAPTLAPGATLALHEHATGPRAESATFARITIRQADESSRSFELGVDPRGDEALRVAPIETCATNGPRDRWEGAIEPLRRPTRTDPMCTPDPSSPVVLSHDPSADALLAPLGRADVTVASMGGRRVAFVAPDPTEEQENLVCVFDDGRAFCGTTYALSVDTEPVEGFGPDAIGMLSRGRSNDLLVLEIHDDHLAIAELNVHVHDSVVDWYGPDGDEHRVEFVSSTHYPYVVRSPTCVALGRSVVWQARFDRMTHTWSRATHRRHAEDGEDAFHERAGTYVLGPGGFARGRCR